MIIKSAVITFDEKGEFRFIDSKDEEAFKRTLSFLNRTKNIKEVELSISTIEDDSTEKQKELFKILCREISQASGQYSFENVQLAFLSYFGYSDINDFPKESFNELLDYSVALANEVFEIEVSINPKNNHIEIL